MFIWVFLLVSYAREDGEDFATDLREKLATKFDEASLRQDRKQMKGGVGWWQQMRSQS